MKNLIIALSLSFTVVSCKSIIREVYGVKKPAFETLTNQKEFLKKNKVTTDFYCFKNLESFAMASQNKFLSVPDAYFFNKKGHFVSYKKSSSDCNAKVDDFINDLANINSVKSDSLLLLTDYLKLLRIEDKELSAEKSDAYVCLNWAIFAGKTNTDKTFEWIHLLDKAKQRGIKVSYFLINCDLQDSWELTPAQKQKVEVAFKN